ncbi:CYTH domain-containing protein [Haloferula chungangensis]|uniref:CYTH domain-containing protein n=1 Tax=Haloferula chungangensis TaxID=1048331 RepID=A0ABW2L7R6_9BACT
MTNDCVEIERKFLLKFLPELAFSGSTALRQGYITTGETEVRLRSGGGQNSLTCKRGDGLVREEYEIPLSDDQFEGLWKLTEGLRIDKTRHHLELDGRTIEIDVYQGPLDSLMIAEVEFESETASREFTIPEFIGHEVTNDSRYKNKNLAKNGLPE